MAIHLHDKYAMPFVTPEEYEKISHEVIEADHILRTKTGAGNAFLGWLELPENYDREEFARIKDAAQRIRSSCDLLVVIGIGGSYLGSRAVIEFLKSPLHNVLPKNGPDIYFAGNSISADSLNAVLEVCRDRDICVNVISKSGTTTEPAIAFRVFRKLLEDRYGKEGARERIFVTTDRAKGTLKQFSTDAGYETFVVPDDVGGRYSVLTPVGLLPIAVAGIDIDELMGGAADAMRAYTNPDIKVNPCYRYAALRNLIHRSGKSVEVLACYEKFATMIGEWWKQLYGESEGKNRKGIFPASVTYSADLHSLGQFMQDGTRCMLETVLTVTDTGAHFTIPDDPDNIDGLNFLSGMDLNHVQKMAMQGTVIAHVDGGVPNLIIEVPRRDARSLGELLYFFELACAISGYLEGVNPFDQPGVESYKQNMFALLGKPGYEETRATLLDRIEK